jgi:hypothetical protein
LKRTNTILLALLIGFTLGIYFGYRIWHKINTTNMIFGPSLKMIPYVTGGEILKWNQPVDMTIGGLCVGPETGITNCTVKPIFNTLPTRFFSYTCGGCQDPDVGGGSSIQQYTQQYGLYLNAAKLAGMHFIKIRCDASNKTVVDPNAVDVHKTDTVQWAPYGAIPKDGWTAAGSDLMTVCGAPTYNDESPTPCTVQNNSTAGTQYNYTVTISSCTGGSSAPASITVR